MISVILVIVVVVIMAFSIRWFDRREITDRPRTGYENVDSPPPQTEQMNSPAPLVGPGEGDSTQGLFLGDNSFLNYRSTLTNDQNYSHIEND